MSLVTGPFKELEGEWLLTPIEHPPSASAAAAWNSTCVRVPNPMSAVLFEPLFEQTASSLVDAFVARARRLANNDEVAASDALWRMPLVSGNSCGQWMLPVDATIADAIEAARAARRASPMCRGIPRQLESSVKPAGSIGSPVGRRPRRNLPAACRRDPRDRRREHVQKQRKPAGSERRQRKRPAVARAPLAGKVAGKCLRRTLLPGAPSPRASCSLA